MSQSALTSGKELYRQLGVDKAMTVSGLRGVMVSTLARNARYVGSIPDLGAIFPIFITAIAEVSSLLLYYFLSNPCECDVNGLVLCVVPGCGRLHHVLYEVM